MRYEKRKACPDCGVKVKPSGMGTHRRVSRYHHQVVNGDVPFKLTRKRKGRTNATKTKGRVIVLAHPDDIVVRDDIVGISVRPNAWDALTAYAVDRKLLFTTPSNVIEHMAKSATDTEDE